MKPVLCVIAGPRFAGKTHTASQIPWLRFCLDGYYKPDQFKHSAELYTCLRASFAEECRKANGQHVVTDGASYGDPLVYSALMEAFKGYDIKAWYLNPSRGTRLQNYQTMLKTYGENAVHCLEAFSEYIPDRPCNFELVHETEDILRWVHNIRPSTFQG